MTVTVCDPSHLPAVDLDVLEDMGLLTFGFNFTVFFPLKSYRNCRN